MCCVVLLCDECNEQSEYMIRMASHMCVEQLVVSKHSFNKVLIGFCKGYAWVHAQAESLHQISVH